MYNKLNKPVYCLIEVLLISSLHCKEGILTDDNLICLVTEFQRLRVEFLQSMLNLV